MSRCSIQKGSRFMLTGQALLKNVRDCVLRKGQGAIWWLGQAGFIVKLGRTVIGIDLFLSPHPRRRIPALLSPDAAAGFDLFLGTHDHRDHIDRPAWPALAQSSPKAAFIVPAFLLPGLANALRLPPERFLGLDDGVCTALKGVRVTGVAAAHELLDRDPATGRYPYLGYLIEGNGFRLYHSGDCCVYEGLQTRLSRRRPDLVLLPINGRDAVRLKANCIGNMTYQEAADLAGALAPAMTIPTHYEMFAGNSENPQLFLDYMKAKYPRLKTAACEHGVRLILSA
jgi:L-ascorbate metabolism protein UlaG (beta-lactamase superfamily)